MQKHKIPLLKTEEETSPFLAALIEFLNTELAPRITRHGVLVEVYGEGVLITGESGAGKSETAIELIKRGHRLIADDAVEIRKLTKERFVAIRRAIFAILLSLEVSVLLMQGAFSVWVLLNQAKN